LPATPLYALDGLLTIDRTYAQVAPDSHSRAIELLDSYRQADADACYAG